MLKSIEIQKNVITVESLALFRPAAKTLAKLGGYIDTVTTTVAELLNRVGKDNVALALDGRVFLERLDKHDYLEIASLKIDYPREFNTTYARITEVLLAVNEVPASLYQDFLVPFESWLAQVVNQPSRIESVSQPVQFSMTRAKTARTQLESILRPNGPVKVPVTHAVRNNKEWVQAIDNVNTIAAQNANVDLEAVLTKVRNIDGLLNTLITALNDTNSTYRPSGAFIDKLVNMTYAMAEEVEFYAQYQFLYGRLVTAMRSNIEQLTKVLA